MQENNFDDELARMDELESEKSSKIKEGMSLNDPISGLSLSEPVVVSAGTKLDKAIKKLQDQSVGCLLVESNGKLAGIFTERDILLKITGKGLIFNKEIVDNYMTHNPEYLRMDDAVAFALNKMVVSGFRHVPIVDENKSPLAVVSLVDIVQQVANAFGSEILNLPPKPLRKGFSKPEGG